MQEKTKVRFVSLRKADTNQKITLGQYKKQQQRQLNLLKSSANEYGQTSDSFQKEYLEKQFTNKDNCKNKFKQQETASTSTRTNQQMGIVYSPQSSKKIESSKNIQQADVISFGISSFFQSLDLLEKGMLGQFLQRLKEECKNTHKQGYQSISNVQNKLESMMETFISVGKSLKCEDIDFSMSPDKSNKGQSFFGLVKDIIFKIIISLGQRLKIETNQISSDLTKTQKNIDFIVKQINSKLQQGNLAKKKLEHSKPDNQQLKKLIQALSSQNQILLAKLSQKLSLQTQINSSFKSNINKILDQKMQIQKRLENQQKTVRKLNDQIIKIQKEFTKQNQQMIYLKQQLENQKAIHLETVQKLNVHIKELNKSLEEQKLQFIHYQQEIERVQQVQDHIDDSQEDDTQENDNISSTEQSRIKNNKQTEKKAATKTKKKNPTKPSGQTTKKTFQKTQKATKKPIPKNSASQKIPQKKSQIKTIKENGLKDTITIQQLCNQVQSLHSTVQKYKSINSSLQQEKKTILYQGLLQSSYLIEYTDITTKSILSSIIKSSTGKMPLQYKLLYKFNRKIKNNFHDYIDHHNNLLLIIRLDNGIIIGGFSPKPLKPSCNSSDGIIFTISSPSSFCSYQIKKASSNSCITYDDYYLVFGNSEIRIKLQQDVVYSNFSTSNSYFDSKGHNIAYFLHGIPHKQVLTQQVSRQVKFEGFQCYQVMFDE